MKSPSMQLPLDNSTRLHELNREVVHWWYDFPQDFPSSLVWDKLVTYRIPPRSTVLDPFCGSGTTLVTSKLLGMHAVGIEAIPLLAFVSTVKCRWEISIAELRAELENFVRQMEHLRDSQVPDDDIDALGMRRATLQRWLRPDVLEDAVRIKKLVTAVPNEKVRGLLLLAFSKSLYEASNAKFCPGCRFHL